MAPVRREASGQADLINSHMPKLNLTLNKLADLPGTVPNALVRMWGSF